MSKKEKTAILNNREGSESVVVRVDKTLEEMFNAFPSPRWDPIYWHPKFDDKLISAFKNKIGDFVTFTTYGQVGERDYVSNGIIHISPANLPLIDGVITGIDYEARKKYVPKDGRNDPERSRLREEDILLSNSGIAATGRAAIFLGKDKRVNISQHINLIRLNNEINKFYVVVYLQGYFAQIQIERFKLSVGPAGITFDEIKAIKIPPLSEKIQTHIEKEYLKMNKYHDKAMKCRKEKDETGYKRNVTKASEMLKELIHNTEELIRGKRKDII